MVYKPVKKSVAFSRLYKVLQRRQSTVNTPNTKKKITFTVKLLVELSKSEYRTRDSTEIFSATVYEKNEDGKFVLREIKLKPLTYREFRFTGIPKFILPYLNQKLWNTRTQEGDILRNILQDKYNCDDIANLSYLTQSNQPWIYIDDVQYLNNDGTISLNPSEAIARDDSTNKYINFKYISYTSTDDKLIDTTYKSQYVLNNFIPQACFFSTILDIYKESYDKWYVSRPPLTYETLHGMIFENKPFDAKDLGASFDDFKIFFEKHNICAYLFDVNYKIVGECDPRKNGKTLNKHLKPSVVYFLYHNEHIYHINEGLHSIKERLSSFKDDHINIKEPTTRYILPKVVNEESQEIFLCDTVEELVNYIHTSKSDAINCVINDSLTDVWEHLYKKEGYEATTIFSKGFISALQINNINKKRVIITSSFTDGQVYHENINDLKLYESTKNRFQTLLLNSNYISSYSSQVLDIFNHYKKGGIIGGLCDTTDEWGFCIDFNKYYTSILADMPKIPIINSFDNFQPYDNRGLEEMTLYLVKKLDNSNTYPRTEYSLCYGVNLIKQKPNVKIISFLKPSKLKTNISKGLIKEIYDTTLEPYAKKFLVNMTIGMLSKKRNRSHYSKAFTDKREAKTNLEKYGGYIHTVKTSRERDAFYIHYLQKEKVLENGFYLMSLYIYDTAEAKLTQLRQELESVGMTNISVNTDCVYTKGEHTKLDEFKRKYPYYFDFNDKNSFDSIGKLKVEAKDLPKFKNLMTMIKEKNVFTPIEKQEVNNIVLKDEWDRNEIKNIINENNRLIIKAEVPGAGKTTSLLDDNKLFVCNWNSLCFDLKKKGMNAVTYNKFFGIKWDGSSEIQGQRTKDIGNYDCVVFDEIYLYTVNQLERIALYMKENKDKKFYATGDEWQLSPIESLSVEDTKEFYNNIINSMFPNQITLKDNKRCTDKEEQQKMKEILNKIKYGTKVEAIKCLKENFKCVKNISTKKNVVAFNWTAEWVNKMLHGNKEKYYVGCELICRKTHSIKGIRTYVNYTYTVVKIDKNFITLTDGEEEIELPLSVVDENFRYSYARTCHSYQGLTENEPITIFNVGHSFVTNEWIFTAVSRATSLSNVLVYEPHLKIEECKIDKNTIQSRIDKYLEEDKRLGRITNEEYVTVDWVLSELSKVKKCSCCKNEFDLTDLESFSTDRIDNSLGHLKMNCRLICRRCNISKK